MPRKSKEVDKNENLEYDYVYRCTECGFETTKPNGKFYKSLYSTSYKHNNQYCHICKACLIQKFENYSKKYDEETAMILICHKIDVPFYYETYRSIINQNNVFNIGMYFRVLTNVQYTNHCFDQTILTRELNKDKEDIRESVEAKWSREEIAHKKSAIE